MESSKRSFAGLEGEYGVRKRFIVSTNFPKYRQVSSAHCHPQSNGSPSPRSQPPLRPMVPARADCDIPMFDVASGEYSPSTPDTYRTLETTILIDERCREDDVCYGALFDARVACLGGFGLDLSFFKSCKRYVDTPKRFTIASKERYYALCSPCGQNFAVIDTNTTQTLHAVEEIGNVRFQAVIWGGAKDSSGASIATKIRRDILNISINIYGGPSLAKSVGRVLTQRRQFLQHPNSVDGEIGYQNPHYFSTPGSNPDLSGNVGHLHHQKSSADMVSREVGKIMESLDVVAMDIDLPETNIIQTRLLEYPTLPSILHINANFKSHQIAALKFIRRVENRDIQASLWKESEELGARSFEHQITNQHQFDFPIISAGGILADDMGLGKTLTMLSAIMLSADEAFCFNGSAKGAPIVDDPLQPTKATLVIVPSVQLVEVWKAEIMRHLEENQLNVTTFHGKDRANEPSVFYQSDLVLTTYATLMKDFQTTQVLYRLIWFRIILDEAHWIRNQETDQFRAVDNLQADRRWCLTGTPIQNSLEDLCALVRFLKIRPFCGKSSKSMFRQHIVDPLFSAEKDPCRNLRQLLRSVCLRRAQNSPKFSVTYEQVTLTLSPVEKALYDKVLEETKMKLDVLVNTSSPLQKYAQLFTSMQRLRRLCNLGQLFEEPRSLSLSNSSSPRSTSASFDKGHDFGCEFCTKEDSRNLMNDLAFCPNCSRLLAMVPTENDKTSTKHSESEFLRVAQSPALFGASGSVDRCLTTSRKSLLETCLSAETYPTKLLRITTRLGEEIHQSKSIVFSYWTKTLDVLGQLLNERQLPFVRIDGNVGGPERSKRLAEFQDSPEVAILLITFGTGAVGLNLTQASRIHIVEPQWNPTVEAQAIGRALRLGQTQKVIVTRYIMDNTIEQNILSIQKRKEKLAKFALKAGPEQSPSERVKELRSVLDIF